MQRNYENNPEKANYIKQNLMKKYPEIFEKYEMSELSEVQVCNLAEFLIAEHPEKYDRTTGTRMDYENNQELQRIYTVVNRQKNTAVLINTNKEGKIPEGEFGVYDLEKHEFQLTNEELRKTIREHIKKYAKDTMTAKEEEQMIVGLSVFGGYNSQEIGKALKMNPNTVRSKRSRALQKMECVLR